MKFNYRLFIPVLVLGVVSLAASACGGAPSAASSSPSPVAIGDACLVGNWMLADDKVVFANNYGSVEGGPGAKLTLGASGQGSLDFTASAPVSGTSAGSSISVLETGSLNLTALATKGSLTLTITSNHATGTLTQNGVASSPQAYANFPANDTYAYTCTAKTLILSSHDVAGDQETQTYAKP
jgi:hypothetical protein